MSKDVAHSTGIPLTLTASWQQVGDEIDPGNYTNLLLWVKWTINNSTNLTFRILHRHDSGGADYVYPLMTPNGSNYLVEAEEFEINVDADANYVYSVPLAVQDQYLVLQAKVGTVGATAATIDGLIHTAH